jgi:type II secretory pathway component PulF
MFEESSQNSNGATAVAETRQRPQSRRRRRQRVESGNSQSSSRPQTSTWERIRNFKVEGGPNRKDILNFTNQLAVMIRAGISLQDSLEAIAEQSNKRKFKLIITDLKNRIESGQSFSQALAEHPQVFTNLYINMVAAAEASGSLSSMLQKLAEYLDSEAETRSQVKSAMV